MPLHVIKAWLKPLKEHVSGHADGVFWFVFIAVPLFTGLLAYHWLPHESYDPETDRLIASHEAPVARSDMPDTTVTVFDMWQDKRTGAIYRPENFVQHRRREASRMMYAWFLYGLIGCAFITYRQHKFGWAKAIAVFALAFAADVVAALVTFSSIAQG